MSAPRICDRCGESAIDGLVEVFSAGELLTVHRIYCELPTDDLAPLRPEITSWGERIKVCTRCGQHVVFEQRTVIDGREYHACRDAS